MLCVISWMNDACHVSCCHKRSLQRGAGKQKAVIRHSPRSIRHTCCIFTVPCSLCTCLQSTGKRQLDGWSAVLAHSTSASEPTQGEAAAAGASGASVPTFFFFFAPLRAFGLLSPFALALACRFFLLSWALPCASGRMSSCLTLKIFHPMAVEGRQYGMGFGNGRAPSRLRPQSRW